MCACSEKSSARTLHVMHHTSRPGLLELTMLHLVCMGQDRADRVNRVSLNGLRDSKCCCALQPPEAVFQRAWACLWVQHFIAQGWHTKLLKALLALLRPHV